MISAPSRKGARRALPGKALRAVGVLSFFWLSFPFELLTTSSEVRQAPQGRHRTTVRNDSDQAIDFIMGSFATMRFISAVAEGG